MGQGLRGERPSFALNNLRREFVILKTGYTIPMSSKISWWGVLLLEKHPLPKIRTYL